MEKEGDGILNLMELADLGSRRKRREKKAYLVQSSSPNLFSKTDISGPSTVDSIFSTNSPCSIYFCCLLRAK